MSFFQGLAKLFKDGFTFIGDMLQRFVSFLAKPMSYIYYFLDGVFYFIYQLFAVVVKIVMVFVALIQFFVAMIAGFLRTIGRMLTINFKDTPIHYPSDTSVGMQVITDLVAPMGLLTVVPGIALALVWFMFAYKVIGLIGGAGRA